MEFEITIVLKEVVVSAFILIMLSWILFWDSEPKNLIKKWWIPWIEKPFDWLGLTHEWRMFAPNPPRNVTWPHVKIHLKNGEVIEKDLHPPHEMNILQKIRYKKFTKFFHRVSSKKAGEFIQTDYAEFLVEHYNIRDTCDRIEIYRMWQRVPAPEKLPVNRIRTREDLVFVHIPFN